MIETRNRAKDPWPIRLKETSNANGALSADGKYYTYTLVDSSQQGTIACFNGNGAINYVYYARFTCADATKVSLAWCTQIATGTDWIAATCKNESLMRVVMSPGCPPLTLHHVGIYTMNDWEYLQDRHNADLLAEPWFSPPINGAPQTKYPYGK